MIIDYQSIGQRCIATTLKGKQCRLPASGLIGGIAVCPYHERYAMRLWNEVKDRLPESIRRSAEIDTAQRNQRISNEKTT